MFSVQRNCQSDFKHFSFNYLKIIDLHQLGFKIKFKNAECASFPHCIHRSVLLFPFFLLFPHPKGISVTDNSANDNVCSSHCFVVFWTQQRKIRTLCMNCPKAVT